MNRKEKVYNILQILSENINLKDLKNGNCGFDATEIGEKLNILRNNASKELNILVSENRVIKIMGKPVHYIDKRRIEKILGKKLNRNITQLESIDLLLKPDYNSDDKEIEENSDIFEHIIGANQSMEVPIKQAKAAILYPSGGMHTLLIGPTGVGKTMFAEMMYKYAVQIGKVKPKAQFIVFNCAKYAENPQLILSQLFGHVKGAFTGADQDKPGLIEKADGGVLLLDEVHRLSPESQEMLFYFMDKNVYRRLGETENMRSADVLLIAATTEDADSVLLKTFLRRIPMVIKIPTLSDRPLTERYRLIKQFFGDQVKCMNVPIKVYKDVIKALLLYDCTGNIGQLKADIQLMCARGFLEYKTYHKKVVEIDTPLVPENVYHGLLNSRDKREELEDLLDIDNKEYYKFTQNNSRDLISMDEYDVSDEIYKEINNKYYFYDHQGCSETEINRKMNEIIEKYLRRLIKKIDIQGKISDENKIFKIVSPRVYNAVEMALDIAERKLKKHYSKNVTIALSMHISSLIERISEGKVAYNENLNEIAVNHPDEYDTAKLVKRLLEDKLDIEIPEEEIGFIAIFLYAIDSENSNKKIGVIVLAHGKHTASSIADVVNSLLDTDDCKSIDMPLDEKVDSILTKAIEMVKKINQGKGVLILVDMGSLVSFEGIIKKETNIDVRAVETISTPVVLEAVRKCMIPEMTLKQLVEDLKYSTPYMGRSLSSLLKDNRKTRIIITTCVTGEGTAVKLADLLKNNLPAITAYNIVIKPMNIYNVNNIEIDEEENIIAVVGSVDLKIPDVPYIPINEILIGNGFMDINNIIEGGNIYHRMELENDIQIPNLTVKMIENSLNFLNPVKAYNAISSSYSKLIKLLEVKDRDDFKTAFMLHSCCMVERALKKEPLSYDNIDESIRNAPMLYKNIKESLKIVEETFGMEIPDTEIGYIMDLIDTHFDDTH